ncbi:MAG TPA: ParB/RepB/Spo0J family partition protein [Ignavibacteria bacterium]|nr:ParB/RepB/Spo0J family partition protein [Ignavibacteria bacterium]
MESKDNRLGKGLSAIFGERNLEIPEEKKEFKNDLFIEIESIDLNPNQPREEFTDNELNELKNSIKEYGLLNPVTVKLSNDKKRYILIAGERRLRATKLLGETKIKASILDKQDMSSMELAVLAIIENIQREDLNPIELSNSYQMLIDNYGLTQEQLAEKVKKQRSTIANILRLQKLPAEIKVSLKKNEISEAHARVLLRIDDREKQLNLWRKVISEKIPVRTLEELTKSGVKEKKSKSKISPILWDPQNEKNEDKLRKFFGTRVKINKKSKDSGEVVIEYYNLNDLERILDKCE